MKFKEYSYMGEFDYLKMEDLKQGYLYRVVCRNADFGIWDSEQKGFVIRRIKFGDIFLFTEYHWDTGAPFGTAKPIAEIEKAPFDNFEQEQKILDYLFEAENNFKN